MTHIDVVPAKRQSVSGGASIFSITTGLVCNKWRAKEPSSETMTRAVGWLVVDEAQMQWRAADIAANILVRQAGLTSLVGIISNPED